MLKAYRAIAQKLRIFYEKIRQARYFEMYAENSRDGVSNRTFHSKLL